MNILFNAIKAQANLLDSRQGAPRFGIVASVDTTKMMARVNLQPEGVLTGWLPILSSWTGSGWGMICPPVPGSQVFIVPHEGNSGDGVIIAGAFSNLRRAPVVPLGEFWLVHQSGSSLKLLNDGTVRINGNLYVQGDIFDKVGSMSQIRSVYDQHVHTDSRGGPTSTPSIQA